jgi:hypothetical protein
MKTAFVKKSLLMLAAAWTAVMASVVFVYLWSNYQQTIETVETRALTLIERDMLYRTWGLTKNGIYVRVSESSQPNPNLVSLPNRDIPHPDGGILTMMTPSNIIQQAFELSNQKGESLSKSPRSRSSTSPTRPMLGNARRSSLLKTVRQLSPK